MKFFVSAAHFLLERRPCNVASFMLLEKKILVLLFIFASVL